MNEDDVTKLIKDLGICEQIKIKLQKYLSKEEFIVDNDDMYNNNCYYIVESNSDKVIMIVDKITENVYYIEKENNEGKKILSLIEWPFNIQKDLSNIKNFFGKIDCRILNIGDKKYISEIINECIKEREEKISKIKNDISRLIKDYVKSQVEDKLYILTNTRHPEDYKLDQKLYDIELKILRLNHDIKDVYREIDSLQSLTNELYKK